ncbi:mechanosensitive ion channel family protein [Pedobacter sp. MC2016-14]|uniref:mechanosensitive ion channel family protein n=1 Tax=Pedobacter sp. MC2016-14 TaxID=2897327 RepID=UPI001E4411EC|nr:mechanosensitive ion channel family protein [Pedobacter sp. MC2016-14]MCD0490612.1 mechanosensitive ion channel family protein [Pedobacter sp. MC2016-14]
MKLTQNVDSYYDKFYDWLLLKGPDILLAIVFLFVGLWLIRIFSRWMQGRMQHHQVNSSLKPFFLNVTIVVLRALLIFLVMQTLGIPLTIFAALVGAIGVAAGLALSGTMQNFASGVLILLLRPFSVSDNIIAQGQEGTVTSIKLFYTVVTTFDNRTVIIPNSKLSNEVIINISALGSRRLDLELKFSYGIDLATVRKVIDQTIAESTAILKTPEKRIGISALEESGYKIMVNVWLNAHGFHDARLVFQENLMQNLKGSGIKLPGMDAKS